MNLNMSALYHINTVLIKEKKQMTEEIKEILDYIDDRIKGE